MNNFVEPLKIELVETPFDMAQALADLAFRLGEGKVGFPVEMRAQALACAETMYGMAEVLASDRAAEVVGESDGSEEYVEKNGWCNV